ncbi:MAG TPA: RluA family pseudouridine synthase, partial [Patescibacteria group bacterium]|nr:RluA family pseudouridine synthase [Patescibacteria group bacterium]
MKIVVEKENINERLDKFLQGKLGDLSRAQIQKMIKAGEIIVGGKEVAAHYFLKEGDEIQEHKNIKIQEYKNGERELRGGNKLKVVAEEKDYIIVNKPAGMVVHPDEAHKSGTLADWLVEKYPEIKKVGDDAKRPGIVHRLDKDVSGLMVVARNQKMFECLKKQFQDRKTEKEYLALAHGVVSNDEDLIEGVIGRSAKSGTMVAGGAKAKKS